MVTCNSTFLDSKKESTGHVTFNVLVFGGHEPIDESDPMVQTICA